MTKEYIIKDLKKNLKTKTYCLTYDREDFYGSCGDEFPSTFNGSIDRKMAKQKVIDALDDPSSLDLTDAIILTHIKSNIDKDLVKEAVAQHFNERQSRNIERNIKSLDKYKKEKNIEI